MFSRLWNDESGAILSAELVLIMTILVIGLIVGMSELQDAIVNELNDVGEAIGALNQSYFYHAQTKREGTSGTVTGATYGGLFRDRTDSCDGNECDISCDTPVPETPKLL